MTEKSLIAPCGMDCGHCQLYLNYKYKNETPILHGLNGGCQGCRPRDKKCAFLKQKCELLKKKRIQFCYECKDFPCESLEKLENRYIRKGWPNSFIDNNKRIKNIGLDQFVIEQNDRFKCKYCGGEICIHTSKCIICGK